MMCPHCLMAGFLAVLACVPGCRVLAWRVGEWREQRARARRGEG